MADGYGAAWAYFGFEGARATKERGAQLCQTRLGRLKLAKTNDPPDAINPAHAAKEYLAQADFPHTDRYVTGPDGLPFAVIGAERFVLTHAPEGHAVDFTDGEQALRGAQTLARFHAAARGFDGECPTAPSLDEHFARGAQTLAAALKQIRKQNKRSDFDILLLKNTPHYEARIAQAQETLAASPCAMLPQQLCHNAVKETHFLSCGEAMLLTSFTAAGRNIALHDLALYLRLCPKADHSRLLEAYDALAPLPNRAELILAALDTYPAVFLRIVEQYYNKKRTWTPAALIKRLQEEVDSNQN